MAAIPAAKFWLSKLEIVGFKSFADLVTIDFSPVLTSIIGSENVGKSNLIAAIKWVLGEPIQDVLFHGNASSKLADFAEARLFFADFHENHLAHPGKKCFGRKRTREGVDLFFLNCEQSTENEYRTALKDISILNTAGLFADQGLADGLRSRRQKHRRRIFEHEVDLTPVKFQLSTAIEDYARKKERLACFKLVERQVGSCRLSRYLKLQITDIENNLQVLRKKFIENKKKYIDQFQIQLGPINDCLAELTPVLLPGCTICLDIPALNTSSGRLVIGLTVGVRRRPLWMLSGRENYLVIWAVVLALKLLNSGHFLCLDGFVSPPEDKSAIPLSALFRHISKNRQIIVSSDIPWISEVKGNTIEVKMDAYGVSTVEIQKMDGETKK